MGRRRTQVNLSPAEQRLARRLTRTCEDPRVVERMQCALLAATGRFTLDGLAAKVRRQRSTVQNWLGKFQAGGLDGLLERETAPGVVSPVAKAKVQRQLVAGLKAGRWSSAAAVADWLRETHSITRSRKSIYYWFRKLGLQAQNHPPMGPGPAQAGKPPGAGRSRSSP